MTLWHGALAPVAVMLAVAAPPAPLLAGPSGPAAQMAAAEAIVAVEILRTDYRATPADGPMYADARILAVVKGRLVRESIVKFGESGWCGPDYQAGEIRILFLRRVSSPDYFAAASWATDCPPGSRIAVYLSPNALPFLSPSQLRIFLEDMEALAKTPPRLKVTVAQVNQGSIVLWVGLINEGRQALWIHPGKLVASFEAGNVRYTQAVRVGGGGAPGWTSILPTRGISGSVTIPRADLAGRDRVALTVTHSAVYFPHLSWAGTLTAAVPLRQ